MKRVFIKIGYYTRYRKRLIPKTNDLVPHGLIHVRKPQRMCASLID